MSDVYLGNPNLKAANVPVQFTKKQFEEYVKCSQDVLYFIENYVKIVNVDHGLVKFNMYPFQKELVKKIHNERFVLAKVARQSGKSTTVVSYILHYALFNPSVRVGILANKAATAREILSRLQLAYEHLPKWMQQGVITWNKGDIELENGSKILAAATSSSAVRGQTFSLIFLDEFAHVPLNIAESFFSSVYPTISSGKSTKVVIVSTPNGLNMFYKMWIDAEEGRNDYVTHDVHWSDVPGRNEEWKAETIRNTSELQFEQEFDCDFIGSQNTLINSSKLRTLVFKNPLVDKNSLKIYENPIQGHAYLLVADVSRGVGLDYSAFSVFDISKTPFRQVATYRDNKVPPLVYPDIIAKVATNYNMAYVLVEINDIGQQVADVLHGEIEYENMFILSLKGRAGQQIGGGFSKNVQLGVRTSKSVRKIGCAALKDMIELDQLIVCDFETIQELNSFVFRLGQYQADEGSNDDLVMTLLLFCWVTHQEYFKEMTSLNLRERLHEEYWKILEEEMLPFAVVDNGEPEVEVDNEGNVWFPVLETGY